MGSRAGGKEIYTRRGHARLLAAIATVQPLLGNEKLDCVKGGGYHSPITTALQEADAGDHTFKPTWDAE